MNLKNIIKQPIIKNLYLMLFFGLLSYALGLVQINMPGMEGTATDFREIPLLIGILYVSNPLYLIGMSLITSMSNLTILFFVPTLIGHSVSLIVLWYLYRFLRKQNISGIMATTINLIYILFYYYVLLIPLIIVFNILVGESTEQSFFSFYTDFIYAARFEILSTSLITSLYVIQFKSKQELKEKQFDLEIKTKEIETQNKVLMKMVSGIKKSSEYIYNTSRQLTSTSQEVSSNASSQAASMDNISNSMIEMLSIINLNTKYAETTKEITENSVDTISKSKEILENTVKSVFEISEKTLIITEIAGKTDILSINAAIEAARSGEAGKGFAVVAHEIRKLADKTKSASDEISELSRNGQKISDIASHSLKKLIPEIVESAKLVSDMVSANYKHQSGIKEINILIQDLSETTNRNSASAEEMSASAEELLEQSELLRKLILSFEKN